MTLLSTHPKNDQASRNLCSFYNTCNFLMTSLLQILVAHGDKIMLRFLDRRDFS